MSKLSLRPFGIELESIPVGSGVEIVDIIKKNSKRQVIKTKWKQTSGANYWHVKTDSTCGIGGLKGWEVVSFKASGHKELLEICKVSKALKKYGLRCSENCGFHVHIDISDFSIEQASILLAYWVKIEPIMLKSVPFFRLESKYCKPISSSIKNKNTKCSALEFWNDYGPKDTSIHGNKDKRVAMNLVNYITYLQSPFLTNSRSTVEFRFPEGTFNEVNVKNWVIFFINFIENIKNKKMPDSLLCSRNLNEFLDISGINDIKNKKWLFYRIFNFDTKKKWREIARKQIGFSNNI